MKPRHAIAALGVIAPLLLSACAEYVGPPPPAGYAGESWRRHVNRCLRHFPLYNPRTDLIERASGPAPCPL